MNTLDIKQMLQEAGDPWEEYPEGLQRGRVITKVPETKTVTYLHKKEKVEKTIEVQGFSWKATDAPDFRASDFLDTVIPVK